MATCDQINLEAELQEMKTALQELKTALQDKEDLLMKTAEFGKTLLDTNHELERQLEEMAMAHSEKIEVLEQEKHSLKLKFECQNSNMGSLQQELDSLHSQLEDDHNVKLKRLEEIHSKKTHNLTVVCTELKANVEKLEIQLNMYREKTKLQEESIEQLKEELSCRGNSTILQHELNDLEQLYTDEHSKCEDLQLRLMEAKGNSDVLDVEREELLQKVASLEEECQERCRLSNEWFESLKEAKDLNVALKSELDLLKMEQRGSSHGSMGNSLFGEVEDKRVDAERKLISLQVKFDSMEKTHSTTKQRYTRLKAEMSALFCRYSATTADSEHVQRLERALSQSNSENEGLRNKVYKLERQLADRVALQDNRKMMSAFVDFGDKAGYIQFLEQEIDQAKADHALVLKELDMKRTQLVWESNKLSEAESKLYHSEQQNARKKEELTRLRIRLQETMEKLNQAGAKVKQIEAEKKFLEGELKCRGHRNSRAPRSDLGTQSKIDHPEKTHPSDAALGDLSSVSSSDSTDSLKKKESNESVNTNDKSQTEHLQPPSRVINLLEELDVEFSKQKKEDQSQTFDFKGAKDENTRPVPVQPKVIHVSNKENVNECSQQ